MPLKSHLELEYNQHLMIELPLYQSLQILVPTAVTNISFYIPELNI